MPPARGYLLLALGYVRMFVVVYVTGGSLISWRRRLRCLGCEEGAETRGRCNHAAGPVSMSQSVSFWPFCRYSGLEPYALPFVSSVLPARASPAPSRHVVTARENSALSCFLFPLSRSCFPFRQPGRSTTGL